jgi:hypothetical protein
MARDNRIVTPSKNEINIISVHRRYYSTILEFHFFGKYKNTMTWRWADHRGFA